jgi:hypothetical protein
MDMEENKMKTLSREFLEKKRPTLSIKDVKPELSNIVKFDWQKPQKFHSNSNNNKYVIKK